MKGQNRIRNLRFILLLSSFLMAAGIFAQVPSWVQPATDTFSFSLPHQFDSNDSLNETENDLTEADSLIEQKISFAGVDVPVFTDSIYAQRLSFLNSEIPLPYNDDVRRFIDLYVLNRRDQVQRMLGLSQFYFPIFENVLTQNGVPADLKYLSVIESALNPNAISRSGATGLWQFMYSTAKLYGLTMNSFLDERRDIYGSTEGAAHYLKNMYDVYGDWLVAIASYNCGPGNINRAITRSGSTSFWEMRKYLPRETRDYVPAFIAAFYVMNYYECHDLCPEYPALVPGSVCSVQAVSRITLDQVSKFTAVSIDQLKFLNPGLKTNVVPHSFDYEFRIPGDVYDLFGTMHDSIVLASVSDKTKYYFGSQYGDRVVYTVRRGDNLGKIAARYHVSVSQLKSWNGLHSTLIRTGQKLKIYPKGSSYAGKTSTASSGAVSSPTTSTSNNSAETKIILHKVIYGDTLWDIARHYGTTIEKLREMNGAMANNLKPGMVLKVQTKG